MKIKNIKLLVWVGAITSLNFTFPEHEATPLKVGEMAPLINAIDHSGTPVHLDSLLKNGPLVVFFYRGSWCPYCNKQMSELQDSLYLLKEKNATVLAISPETNKSMNKIINKSEAEFIFVSDTTYAIMNAYKVSFKVDDKTLIKYKSFGINIEKSNGNNDNILPVPATYVIGKDGIIKLAYFDTNYKKRVTIKQVLTALE